MPREHSKYRGYTVRGTTNCPLKHPVAFKEVSHWADLPLDFALIGLDGCGTTSLRRNLAKHPATWAVKNGWIPMMDSDD